MTIAVVGVTFSVAVSSVAMATAIALWVYMLLMFSPRSISRTPLDIYFLCYAMAEILSTIFAVEPAASFVNMKRLFLIAIVYLVCVSIDTEFKLKGVLWLLVGVGALLSFLEIFSIYSIRGHFMRVSLFQYFLTEGGIKMFLLLLALPFVFHPSTPRNWRIGTAACSLPLMVGLILTQTRSAWLGLLAGTLTIGFLRNKYAILFIIILVVIVLFAAPLDYRTRAASIIDPTDRSNLARIHMITTGWKMFLDHPIFGVGDIDLKKIYVTYITPIDSGEGGHLHNNFMTLLVTLGFVGIAATMALFVKIFLMEFGIARFTRQHWLLGSLSLGSLAGYIGFHVNGLFEWNFGDHEIAVLLWFTVGLSLVSRRLHSLPEEGGTT